MGSGNMPGEGRTRTIKLFCPALSKTVPFLVSDDQRIDLGLIARTFGLEPASLKLNRHFLSRGTDLIASSVTWKSLVSYFSSRSLSTGVSDAIVVDGKLCRIGNKRAHVPGSAENGIHHTAMLMKSGLNTAPQLEEANLPKKTKLNEGFVIVASKAIGLDDSMVKRKQCFDEVSPSKRIRTTGFNSGSQGGGGGDDFTGTISNSQFSCSFISERMKRMRDDTVDVAAAAAPCKRSR